MYIWLEKLKGTLRVKEAPETSRSGSHEPVDVDAAGEMGEEAEGKHTMADTVREALQRALAQP